MSFFGPVEKNILSAPSEGKPFPGLPSPRPFPGGRGGPRCPVAEQTTIRDASSCPWIIKAVWEHASRGLDDENIVPAEEAESLGRRLRERQRQNGRPWFAEQFIAGREFNLSVLDGPAGGGGPSPGRESISPPSRRTSRTSSATRRSGRRIRSSSTTRRGDSTFPPRMKSCSAGSAAWRCHVGSCSICGATPGSISASTAMASRGFSRSTRIPVSRRTLVSRRRWNGRGSATTMRFGGLSNRRPPTHNRRGRTPRERKCQQLGEALPLIANPLGGNRLPQVRQ